MGLKLNDFYKAKISRDNRKYKVRLGWDINLFELINEGLIEVVGMRDKGPEKGELEYTTTEKGKKYLDSISKNEANNIVSLMEARKRKEDGDGDTKN